MTTGVLGSIVTSAVLSLVSSVFGFFPGFLGAGCFVALAVCFCSVLVVVFCFLATGGTARDWAIGLVRVSVPVSVSVSVSVSVPAEAPLGGVEGGVQAGVEVGVCSMAIAEPTDTEARLYADLQVVVWTRGQES